MIDNLTYTSPTSCYMSLLLVPLLPLLLSSGQEYWCSFGNLLGLHALMVEYQKSKKVPETAELNLKERNHYAV